MSLFATHRICVFLFARVKTEYAKYDVHSEYVDACALFIRDEILVKDDSKFVRLTVDDKKRVAKNQVIYRTYDSEEDLNSDYQSSLGEDGFIRSNNIDFLNYQINNFIRKFTREKKYYPQIEKFIINKESIMKKGVKNISKSSLGEKIKFNEVRSKENGIFSYFVDGFEEQLSTEVNFNSLNFKDYKKEKSVDGNVLGKIIVGSKCIMVCDKKLDPPGNYDIKLEMSSDEIKCYLSQSYDKISIFEAEIDDNLINSRLENVKIRTSCVEGIKIKKGAVHEVGGQKGVFILDKRVFKFKKINIKYESNNCVICERNESDPLSLHEGDAVVVNGANLYDGKVSIY